MGGLGHHGSGYQQKNTMYGTLATYTNRVQDYMPQRITQHILNTLYPWIAACCAKKVVDTAGQPLPGPSKFCRVIRAAWSLARLSLGVSPVGNPTATEGLLVA